MPDEIVTVNPNDPDGRIIYIRGADTVLRMDVVRAQLILVQLSKAITAATDPSTTELKAGDLGRLSVKQRNYILAMCTDLEIVSRPSRLALLSRIVDRVVDSTDQLTGPEASRVIDELQRRTRRAADATTYPEGAF